MGSWGTQPLENDGALDLQSEFTDTQDITVLDSALETVLAISSNDYLDAIDAEMGVAAVYLILQNILSLNLDNQRTLLQKTAAVLGRVIENSELQELWAETESYGDWLDSITSLMQQVLERLQGLD